MTTTTAIETRTAEILEALEALRPSADTLTEDMFPEVLKGLRYRHP